MKHTATKSILITLASVALLSISGTALAITNAGLKACKMAVLEKSKFHDLPMAAVSVYPGNKSGKAHFSVRWDGLRAEGNCRVSGSYVEKVKINEFHDGRTGNAPKNKWESKDELDGFYWDRHVGMWRDPDGRKCHSCTPENGFPNKSKSMNYQTRPKNEFEREMQRELKNTFSSEDLRELQNWADDNR